MSKLILSWLNDEVQLSKKITNFEYDFSNGYYFGELLSLKNQQLNFGKFVNENKRAARLSNWQFLKPTFTSLGIKLAPRICNDIMCRKRGVALNYLYKLKMALEKVKNPTDMAIYRKKGSFPTRSEIKIIKPARVQFDKMENNFFSRRLNETNQSQKVIDLENHLERFIQDQHGIEKQVEAETNERLRQAEQQKQERRSNQLNELQRAQAFREDWEQKGYENWVKNQKVKRNRLKMVEKFKETQRVKKENHRLKKKHDYEREVYEGIDAFEQNLKKFGLSKEESTDMPEEPKDGTKSSFGRTTNREDKTQKGGLTFKSEATIEKIRMRKRLRDMDAKERDKRRRKMIVDQNNSQRNFEIKKREEMLIEKLQQHSKQEKEIQYEIWRAIQCEKIIRENRILRENKYAQKREILTMNSKSKAEKMLEIFNQEYHDILVQKQLLQRELEIQFKQGKRKENYNYCHNLVNAVYDITEAIHTDLQNKDKKEIEKKFWDQCIDLFMNNNKIIDPPSLKSKKKEQEEANGEIKKSEELLSNKQFESYLSGKGEWLPTHDIKYDEEDETPIEDRIPKKVKNDFYLGDLLELVIDLQHPKKPEIKKTDIPNWLPLKLSLLGYAFAGKKTLAELVQQKYNLELISVEDLINECIEIAQVQQDEDEHEREDLYGFIEDQKRRIVREKLVKDEDYKQIGQRVLESIKDGKEISNDVYEKLILHKIKRTFPCLTNEEFIEEYFKNETYKPEDSKEEKEENKEDSSVKTKKEREYVEIMKSPFKFTKGWLLLDYPLNYQQAQDLEKGLTNFLTYDDRTIPEGEILKKNANTLAKSTPKIIAKKKLIRSGIDCVCVVQVDKDSCLKRAFGRRIDPENNDIYHLDENPPPTDDSSKVEKLECYDDPYNSELSIMDKHCTFDDNKFLMKQWFNKFGFQEHEFKSWNEFNGLGERFEVFKRMDQLIQQILKFKYEKAVAMKEEIEQRDIKAAAEKKRIEEEEKEASKIRAVDNALIDQQVKELKQPSKVVYKITDDLAKNILHKWEATRKFYISNVKNSFETMRNQKLMITSYFADIQRKFIQLLTRPDGKSIHILKYQQDFNGFIQKYPDLIEEEQAKEEFHQRVDDLHDILWEIIENKKDEASNERKAIMNSGWVDGQIMNYINHMKNLMKIEILYFWSVLKILQDFYNYSMGKELPLTNILNFEEYDGDLLEMELLHKDEETDEVSFPRLDFLYEKAEQLLIPQEEEGQDKVKEKQQKQAKGKGKGKGKTGAKKDAQADEDEVEVVSPLEEEMNKAIFLEKQNIRYKLYMIKQVTLSRIQSLISNSEIMYQKMEDWQDYNITVENEAVEKLAFMFRDHIEEHLPIQKELRIEVIDIVESYKFLNFSTPPPVIIPAKEVYHPNRFSILQLYRISQELRSLQNNAGILENNIFLEFMDRRLKNNVSGGYFPEIFSNLKKENILELIRILDPNGKGYISVCDFFTYLCVLQSPIMNEERREFYLKHVAQFTSDDEIDLPIFLNCPAWFDVTEGSPSTENQEKFDRPMQIKQLLFSIHKNPETDLLSMKQYLKTLSVIDYNDGKIFKQFDSYYSLLFE